MTAVWLPIKTAPGLNAREHWAKRAKRCRTERLTARALCPTHALPCVVTLTRHSAGTLDDDNLRGALKAVRDGVADRLGVADNDPRVTWHYAQARTRRGTWGVEITLEPV